MKKQQLEMINKILSNLRILSIVTLFALPFVFGETVFHIVSDTFILKTETETISSMNYILAVFITFDVFIFPLAIVNILDKIVYNKIIAIEKEEENKLNIKKRACNLGMK